ncbi:MAG TPA: hypothetical protein PLT28_00390 [Saprospiraceae bacterium]|nr:hypothetical protein [Saprospiraceae bacterium]
MSTISFSGIDFIFDGQFSGEYGLYLLTTSGSIESEDDAGSDVSIINDVAYRKPTVIDYGSSMDKVLTFELSVMSEVPLLAQNRSKVEQWLFGRTKRCQLQIVQNDLMGMYFNCYLTSPKAIYISHICYGYTFTVECDAPWAWGAQQTTSFGYSSSLYRTTLNLLNDSDNTDYTYPILTIYMNGVIGSGIVSIINTTDDETRELQFTNLVAGEIITVDCEKQIITSSIKQYVSDYFNKKFLRLLSGYNSLSVMGDLSNMTISYTPARKVGG